MTTPRILIVEDERIVAAGLRTQLQTLGYEVAALATSGEEAVRQAGELRPDLVLMDIHLDGGRWTGWRRPPRSAAASTSRSSS